MTKVPSLHYEQVVRALRRDGWVVVRQRGSHIRLQKRLPTETLKLVVPAHHPIKRSTLARILKQAQLTVEALQQLLLPRGISFFFLSLSSRFILTACLFPLPASHD